MATYRHLTPNDIYEVPANGATIIGRSFADPQIRVLDSDGTTYLWGSSTTFEDLTRDSLTQSTKDPVSSNTDISIPGGSTLTMSTKTGVWIGTESI